MRAELVERVHEGVESFLLLQKTVSRRPCGVLFESAVHPLVSAVLLRLAGLDAFRDNPELEPKHGEAGKAEKPVRCEWRTVVGADDQGQGVAREAVLEDSSRCHGIDGGKTLTGDGEETHLVGG